MAARLINLSRQSAYRLAANPESKRSSILILALWSVCLLASFAVILGYQVRQELTLVNRVEEKDKLHLIADAGVKKAIAALISEPVKAYDSLADTWSNNANTFRDMHIGAGRVNIIYQYYNEKEGAFETFYGLIDEERKININRTDKLVLERLFMSVSGLNEAMAQDLAASIIDWQDKDDELSLPSVGAEDNYYRTLPHAYVAKNAEFEALNELFLVKGVTRDVFERIKNYLTVYGNGKVNINTCPAGVLSALGLSQDTIDKIISFRAGEDKSPGTADDNVFEAPDSIVTKLRQFYQLSDTEAGELQRVCAQSLDTKSDNFTIQAEAQSNNNKNRIQITCVVKRDGKILYWQE